MGNLKKKNAITKHIKKKPSVLIRVIKKNKNSLKESRERERERERVFTVFVQEKYGLNGRNNIKFTQIKWEEEESSYRKEKRIKEV